MSSEEPELAPKDDPVVGWYRRDLSRRILGSLLPAAGLVIVGSVAVGIGITRLSAGDPALAFRSRATFVSEEPVPRRSKADYAIFFTGLALVIAGTVTTASGLRSTMGNDDYLLLRASGLFEHENGEDKAISWDEIESVTSEEGVVKILLRNGTERTLATRYAGVTTDALAKQIADAHRKGIWGLLGRR
jgi:hypothetical protein